MNWVAAITFMALLPAGLGLLAVLNAAVDRWGEARVWTSTVVAIWLLVSLLLGARTT